MSASTDSARAAAARDVFLRFVAAEGANDVAAFERLCAGHPSLARELRVQWTDWNARSEVVSAPTPTPRSPHELLAKLSSSRGPHPGREIARGGMGAVVEAWDDELNRRLAMKTMLVNARGPTSSDMLARFLEEAQVTGQLEHPGIVPVHQLGVDDRGRPFFTMRLVEGRDVRAIFALAWAGAEGWNQTRALGVLQKVCEAMAYAHDKGVLHRDLKPANVMVGRFGEVYVMDWGVARVLGREDAHGLHRDVATVRSNDEAAVLVTRDGDVVGTPAYMAPEQARGEVERLSPQSDIYSVGAMLYQLLAQHPPYLESQRASFNVLARVLTGPPSPLSALDPPPQPELLAICERAMEREPQQRYASMLDFADDLRAYLEGRVVRAYETGAWAELRKWVLRNKALAGASVAALVAVFGGLSGISVANAKRVEDITAKNSVISAEKTRADDNASAATREAERARREALTAERTIAFLDEVLREMAPLRAMGKEPTVADVFERVTQRLRDELHDEPAVRGRLLELIGSTFSGLGRNASAVAHLEASLETARREYGPEHAVTLHVQQRLAQALIAGHDFVRAREVLEHLLAIEQRVFGAADRRALDTTRSLAILARERGDLELAEELYGSVLDRASGDAAYAAQVQLELVPVLLASGRAEEAQDRLSSLLDDRRSDVPESVRLQAAQHLVSIAKGFGELERAEELQRELIERLETAGAASELQLAAACHELAVMLAKRERRGEALEIQPRALAIYRRVYGESHASTLAEETELAEMLSLDGCVDEAEPLVREAVELWPRVLLDFNVTWSRSLRVLMQIRCIQGRWAEAEALARERWECTPDGDPEKQKRRADWESARAHLEWDR